MQKLLNHFARSCEKFGLKLSLISFRKNVTMSQSSYIRHFTIINIAPKNVEKFTYLESTIIKNTTVDQEVDQSWTPSETIF